MRDLPDLLGDGDLLVVNDSKVIPARLRLHRETGGAAEVLLLEPLERRPAHVGGDGPPGSQAAHRRGLLDAAGDAAGRDRSANGGRRHVRPSPLLGDGDPLATLQRHGEMPLPPYITAPLAEPDRYQTVYAAEPGSAARADRRPALHPRAARRDRRHGRRGGARSSWSSASTRSSRSSSTIRREHVMHSERYRVDAEVIERCRTARRVVAVGTTSVARPRVGGRAR